MEFIHDPYEPGETIAAIATPIGEGGVAIIRISGQRSIEIAEKIFSGPIKQYKTHTAHYGQVIDFEGKRVDDVLILVMLGKRSYTGEDTVEIHCHGGSLITRRVLDLTLQAGARQARPGEFTFKAFMNGKIDLVQAEAVQELICAKNERALDAAENHLQGLLSKKIAKFQEGLTLIAAILEAWVDFPDEGLEFATMSEIIADLEAICAEMEKLDASYHNGKIVQDGVSLCLIGSPNVGKSSLMNALLEKDRAIVSPFPGTTRDVLEDHLRLNGLNFTLLDTAGIRKSEDIVEQEGIRRSQAAMNRADLILFVLDLAKGIDLEDLDLIGQAIPSKTILVLNKSDLPHKELRNLDFPHSVTVSAKEGFGLDLLREKIEEIIWENGPPSQEEIIITNIRHKEALHSAIHFCRQLITGLKTNISPEFISIDIRECLKELGKIIGTNVGEDIISAIFSKFCIGK
jgi:tRNA modification GTPase